MFKSSNLQGASGVGAATMFFTGLGYPVFTPVSDCRSYDMIVDIEGVLQRVECKTSTFQTPSGGWQVELRSKGGNFSAERADLVFVWIPAQSEYKLYNAMDLHGRSKVTI